MLPAKVFFTKGMGVHREKLTSYEVALRNAGIARFNLVNVSSILPPNCKKVSREDGLKELKSGEIVYWITSSNQTDEPNRLIVASVGCAIPADPNQYGYLSEHHAFGKTEEKAGVYAENLAALMLATILENDSPSSNLKNPETEQKSFLKEVPTSENSEANQEENRWAPVLSAKSAGKISKTLNVTQSSLGNKDGLWTTVVAAAVFVGDGGGVSNEK